MKTKKLLIAVLIFLQWQMLFSQCLNVKLSVIWEMESDILKEDSIVNVPKLSITYHNNCTTNYYFLKLSKNRGETPWFRCAVLTNPPREKLNSEDIKKKLFDKYVNQNFNVTIGKEPAAYAYYWWLHNDSINMFEERLVNCNLESIYEYIYEKINPHYVNKREPFKHWFEPEDILPENISNFVKDQFVFLKAGESYTDTYNLIGFKLVEGCFTFILPKNTIENYILTTQYDLENEKYKYQELELPAVIGEYQLFSGAFNTNKVTVCFGEK